MRQERGQSEVGPLLRLSLLPERNQYLATLTRDTDVYRLRFSGMPRSVGIVDGPLGHTDLTRWRLDSTDHGRHVWSYQPSSEAEKQAGL